MNAKVDKLDVAKLVNVPNSLNNLNRKLDDLGVSLLKAIPVDLKKLSNVVIVKLLRTQNSTH